MKVPYSFIPAKSEQEASHLYILGDITEFDDFDWGMDGSPQKLTRQLKEVSGELVVHIDSYGGPTSAGITMYNLLKQCRAKVTTIAEGFVCSAASLVFMAGDERLMRTSSILMIHNAWCEAVGNAEQLRKQADDLDVISKASAQIYVEVSGMAMEDVLKLMDFETWISPDSAVELGFATGVSRATAMEKAASSAFTSIMNKLLEKADPAPMGAGEPDKQPAQAVKPDKSALQRWFGY